MHETGSDANRGGDCRAKPGFRTRRTAVRFGMQFQVNKEEEQYRLKLIVAESSDLRGACADALTASLNVGASSEALMEAYGFSASVGVVRLHHRYRYDRFERSIRRMAAAQARISS